MQLLSSVGLNTRTEVSPLHAWSAYRPDWRRDRLAAESTGEIPQSTEAHWRALQPGHYGREGRAMSRAFGLKSAAASLSAGVQLPAAGPPPAWP